MFPGGVGTFPPTRRKSVRRQCPAETLGPEGKNSMASISSALTARLSSYSHPWEEAFDTSPAVSPASAGKPGSKGGVCGLILRPGGVANLLQGDPLGGRPGLVTLGLGACASLSMLNVEAPALLIRKRSTRNAEGLFSLALAFTFARVTLSGTLLASPTPTKNLGLSARQDRPHSG